MKLALVFAGLMMVLVFGAVSAFDGLPTAGTSLASGSCTDDWDEGSGADGGDDNGNDDERQVSNDPEVEEDDCPTPLTPYVCGDMTAAGVYLFDELNFAGNCLFLPPSQISWNYVYVCTNRCWNDAARSIKLVGTLPDVFLCVNGVPANEGGYCVFMPGDMADLGPTGLDQQSSSVYFGYNPLSVDPPIDVGGVEETSFAAADADCDGGVGVADALTNLQYLSGFEVGCVGDWNGDSYQGDADCSGAIAAGDVTAILAAVLSGAMADC